MSRRLAATGLTALAAVALAACSSSSGTQTRSDSPPPTVSSATSTSAPPSSASPSAPKSSTSSKPTDAPISTPKVTAAAQHAVNAYMADFNAALVALRDPAHADLSWIAKYETGKFRRQDEQSFSSLKAHHLAYRGAPPNPNVKVQSILSATSVVLTSCLVVNPSDPWVQYDTVTGKAVPTGKPRNPPPPYLLQFFMRSTHGSWQIASVVQNTSKTCKG